MMTQAFQLVPFPEGREEPPITLAGTISRANGRLSISYKLSGRLDHIEIAGPASLPSRLHRLWETTCFEFFLSPPDRNEYWEFNLSPAGHWNAYHFDGYRSGMREEERLRELPFSVGRKKDSLELAVTFDASSLFPHATQIIAGITAVIRMKSGDTSYWALAHPGPKADFHHRAGFLLRL